MSKLIESNDEYDLYEVPLGHLYHFKQDCKTIDEFRGQKAGTSRMKYSGPLPPRSITLRQKYRERS